MLFNSFKNYEEFKALFKQGDRKPKLLLALITCKIIQHNVFESKIHSYFRDTFECSLYRKALKNDVIGIRNIIKSHLTANESSNWTSLKFNSWIDIYPDKGGICEDASLDFIRYKNSDGKIYKMRAGKYFGKVWDCSNLSWLPRPIKIWMTEEFVKDWHAYVLNIKNRNVQLFIDDNFEFIYGNHPVNSCMAGQGHYFFYQNAVYATAAYILDENGVMLARCVIFDEVFVSGEDTKYVLAERQYAIDDNDAYKQLLVNKLIEEKYIDGYKTVGASCRDSRNFVLNDGTSLCDKLLYINCNLEAGDIMSYQDSFKYYNIEEHLAYNFPATGEECDLAITDLEFRGNCVWSEYHDCYIPEDEAYYVDSESDYFYEDEVVYAKDTGEWELAENCTKCDTGEWVVDPDEIQTCIYCGRTYYSTHFHPYCSLECRVAAIKK